MQVNKCTGLLTIGIVLAATLPLHADVVELKVGNPIEGKVLSVNSSVIKIRNEKGRVVINRNKVKSIIFDEDLKDRKPEQKVHKQDEKKVIKQPEQEKQPADEQKQKLTLRPKVKLTSDKEVQQKEEIRVKQEKTDAKKTEVLSISSKQEHEKASEKSEVEKVAKMPSGKGDIGKKYAKVLPQKIKISKKVEGSGLDYVTYIKGLTSGKTYYGIYSNVLEGDHLSIYLPEKVPQKLFYKLHAQKNGRMPPLYTASSVVFIDKEGNVISKTNPLVVENDHFIEWFVNLENIAGVTGDKFISVAVPPNTYLIKIIGYRPGSKNNLVGYISEIKLDDKPVTTLTVK
jgi:hypothetical protein